MLLKETKEILKKNGYRLVEAYDDKNFHKPSNELGPTVKIGKQTWMAKNLAIDDGGEGIYHNPENNETYYTYDAAMRIANSITGWHLPSTLEWNEAALVCGATEKPDFIDNAQELKYKLGVKLDGFRYEDSFYGLDGYAYFWTATEYSSSSAYCRYFSTDVWMDSNYYNKTTFANSVRLVKD